MRDLVSMVAAATERCCFWPKTAVQDVKCVRAHCRGAGSSCHPDIFTVVFGELIHANVARPQVEFLVNCLPVGSVLVVYDTLRIKKNACNMTFVLLRTWRPFFGRGDKGPFDCDDYCFVSGSYP